MKEKWQRALSEYLQERESLSGIVVLMDIRHPLKDLDRQMVEWSVHNHLPVLVLLTKADKLKRGPMKNTVFAVQKELDALNADIEVLAFSSLNGTGRDALINKLHQWYKREEDIANTEDTSQDPA